LAVLVFGLYVAVSPPGLPQSRPWPAFGFVGGCGQDCAVQVAVVAEEGGGLLQPLTEAGAPAGPAERVDDLAAAVGLAEARDGPRWVWAVTAEVYAGLVRAGVRVGRCHDLALTEAILLGHEGCWGQPRSLAAAWARARGLPVPQDPPAVRAQSQPALFEPATAGFSAEAERLAVVAGVYARQVERVAGSAQPGRLRLLVAAESAGALSAVEMSRRGVPWRVDVHDALLTELLGPRPRAGLPPRRLGELADRIGEAFGGRVNPDSPVEVQRAFARVGIAVASTRARVLEEVDHPAVPLLLQYKELARLHAAHGWAWLDTWVSGGRFRPEYVPGGVVSGRWAARGGGALQIPHAVRRAVMADPGWVLVVADAAQLEPRVLAALSGDDGLATAASAGDLYQALAEQAFGGDRPRAKTAMLAAMYGAVRGGAGALVAALQARFPAAIDYLEQAARSGERGGLVRSQLGRTCPPPSPSWHAAMAAAAEPHADQAARRAAAVRAGDRGRFTRNFVVQATAADWALVLLAALRRRLAELTTPDRQPAPELVFFQHDEVVIHCPTPAAPAVTAALTRAAAEASDLVFPATTVQFPLQTAVVTCYADAK
jgi:DNA polymerase-1